MPVPPVAVTTLCVAYHPFCHFRGWWLLSFQFLMIRELRRLLPNQSSLVLPLCYKIVPLRGMVSRSPSKKAPQRWGLIFYGERDLDDRRGRRPALLGWEGAGCGDFARYRRGCERGCTTHCGGWDRRSDRRRRGVDFFGSFCSLIFGAALALDSVYCASGDQPIVAELDASNLAGADQPPDVRWLQAACDGGLGGGEVAG